jgi:predicted dehydrogenase
MGALRVLVVGLGTMGKSHARAYAAIDGFALAGLVTNRPEQRTDLANEFPQIPLYGNFDQALAALRPDVVSVNTYTQDHADLCLRAFAAGCHVFCEKPLAPTLEDAERVVAAAVAASRKLLIGYILRVHPSWTRFVEIGRTLGKPLVMRMNLNQQSSGHFWEVHKSLMLSTSPIVDCGVHYVDIMCLVTGARPVAVHALGARLSEEIAATMYNYGHLHIAFDDGSVGWYEAGWGPMMSETAFFVKDMIGPNGSVSIVSAESGNQDSSDHDGHTRTSALRLHRSKLNGAGAFAAPDQLIVTEGEPDLQALCELEQRLLLDSIRTDANLASHHRDALNSLRIVFAADESVRTGKLVQL